MKHLTDRQAMLCALDDAIQWQEGWREANVGCDPEQVANADRRIAAYRRVYGRMTGGKATFREINGMAAMRDCEVLSIAEVKRRIDTGEMKQGKGK